MPYLPLSFRRLEQAGGVTVSQEERFQWAIETLLADRSPREAVLDLSTEHRRMLRIVQLLRGSRNQEPAPELRRRLRARIFPLLDRNYRSSDR